MLLRAVWTSALQLCILVGSAGIGLADEMVRLDTGAVPVETVRNNIERSFQLPQILARIPAFDHESIKSAMSIECDRIKSLMRFSGYLTADVDCAFTTPDVIKPVLGPVFRIATVEVDGTADLELEPQARQDLANYLQKAAGQIATHEEIVSLGDRVIRVLTQNNYPLAQVLDSQFTTYNDLQLASLTLKLDAGRIPIVGKVTFRGLQTMTSDSLIAAAPLKEGDQFNSARLSDFEKRLIESNKFKHVRVSVERYLDADGTLPISISVQENLPTVAASPIARSGLWFGMAAGLSIFTIIGLDALQNQKKKRPRIALKAFAVVVLLLTMAIFILRFLELTKGIV